MKQIKALTALGCIAAVILIISVTIPVAAPSTTAAQENYDPSFDGNTDDAQGSPRSALDDQRVLLIGDSHVEGAPGRALAHHLTAAGATYYVRAGRVGWGVRNWYLARRQVNRLIREHQPTLLVLILGGNDWSRVETSAPNTDYRRLVRDFWVYVTDSVDRHARAGSLTSACWIEPPSIVGPREDELQPRRDAISRAILAETGEAQFVRSNDLTGTFGRTPDGIHFTFGGANDWMRRTTPRLARCVERQHPNIR